MHWGEGYELYRPQQLSSCALCPLKPEPTGMGLALLVPRLRLGLVLKIDPELPQRGHEPLGISRGQPDHDGQLGHSHVGPGRPAVVVDQLRGVVSDGRYLGRKPREAGQVARGEKVAQPLVTVEIVDGGVDVHREV